MADVVFRPAVEADGDALFAKLRPADFDEVAAASGPDVLGTVRQAVACSTDVRAAVAPDGLLALYGVIEIARTGVGIIWMLGTTTLDRYPGVLTKEAKRYTAEMLARCPRLVNYVDARNHASLRWLKRLGFAIEAEPMPYGYAGLPFHYFERAA